MRSLPQHIDYANIWTTWRLALVSSRDFKDNVVSISRITHVGQVGRGKHIIDKRPRGVLHWAILGAEVPIGFFSSEGLLLHVFVLSVTEEWIFSNPEALTL